MEALAEARRRHSGVVELLADPYASGFYERLGARRAGDVPAPMPGARNRTLPKFEFDLDAESLKKISTFDEVSMVLMLVQDALAQNPPRVVPGASPAVKPALPGDQAGRGARARLAAARRVPTRPPGDSSTMEADWIASRGTTTPRLDDGRLHRPHAGLREVPMTCGGRMPGDPVFLTWKTVKERAAGGRRRVPAAQTGLGCQSVARSGGGADAWKSR